MSRNVSSRRGMLWTRDEDEQLRHLINRDLSLADISMVHGRTPFGIVTRLMGLGLLVSRGDAYHMVNPEPWTLGAEVRRAQSEFIRNTAAGDDDAGESAGDT